MFWFAWSSAFAASSALRCAAVNATSAIVGLLCVGERRGGLRVLGRLGVRLLLRGRLGALRVLMLRQCAVVGLFGVRLRGLRARERILRVLELLLCVADWIDVLLQFLLIDVRVGGRRVVDAVVADGVAAVLHRGGRYMASSWVLAHADAGGGCIGIGAVEVVADGFVELRVFLVDLVRAHGGETRILAAEEGIFVDGLLCRPPPGKRIAVSPCQVLGQMKVAWQHLIMLHDKLRACIRLHHRRGHRGVGDLQRCESFVGPQLVELLDERHRLEHVVETHGVLRVPSLRVLQPRSAIGRCDLFRVVRILGAQRRIRQHLLRERRIAVLGPAERALLLQIGGIGRRLRRVVDGLLRGFEPLLGRHLVLPALSAATFCSAFCFAVVAAASSSAVVDSLRSASASAAFARSSSYLAVSASLRALRRSSLAFW